MLYKARNDPGNAESLSNRFKTILQQGFDKAWPHHCWLCGQPAGAQAVCAACDADLPRLIGSACPCCALPSPGGLCGRCLRRPPDFDATHAAFAYHEPVRSLVLALKHGRGFMLTDWFVHELQCCAGDLQVDAVLPMPLHPARLAERGYNQAMELARRFARQRGLPLLAQAVVRDVDTPHLAGLRQRERRRAVRGVFRCVRDLAGQHVLVIDDVMTSGATLNELAATLKGRGAARVSNLLLARTLRMPGK